MQCKAAYSKLIYSVLEKGQYNYKWLYEHKISIKFEVGLKSSGG